MKISLVKTTDAKPKPDENNLGFGRFFTDHMFIMDYEVEKGWHDPRIVQYAPLKMDPSTAVFHYGQAVFEGMKAFKDKEGKIRLFRPEQNMARLNRSNERMCIPKIDENFALKAIKKLIEIESDWIPTAPGTSLYVRPFIIATDITLGVHPAHNYYFMVILSPVGAYYAEGINPVSIYVEPHYVRAVRGGTGHAKAAGNYAGSLIAQQKAAQKGYSQVLWLDGLERKYIEEVGAMNVFFNISGELITPDLGDSVLPGITRDSVITLLKSWGIPVVERRLSVEELFKAHAEGKLIEAFGCGTAAVISPIGKLEWQGQEIEVTGGKIGELTQRIYDTITGIQSGKIEDEFGWVQKF
ncbi:MAG: branched-chain amino acid aminotransferase [Bacillota bacterium]|nr:branched-chain amino acid aminotransferase [Bacillota bacterium]HHU61952.1 branched-chain amino acid aminotransferase [Natronincola sp.]